VLVQLIDIQMEKYTLEEEINVLNPDVAIFSTARDYDRYIKDFLPIKSMKGPEGLDPKLKVKEIKVLGRLAFRTYHFQYYSNPDFKDVVDYI
jgi:hypothetical protein